MILFCHFLEEYTVEIPDESIGYGSQSSRPIRNSSDCTVLSR